MTMLITQMIVHNIFTRMICAQDECTHNTSLCCHWRGLQKWGQR